MLDAVSGLEIIETPELGLELVSRGGLNFVDLCSWAGMVFKITTFWESSDQ